MGRRWLRNRSWRGTYRIVCKKGCLEKQSAGINSKTKFCFPPQERGPLVLTVTPIHQNQEKLHFYSACSSLKESSPTIVYHGPPSFQQFNFDCLIQTRVAFLLFSLHGIITPVAHREIIVLRPYYAARPLTFYKIIDKISHSHNCTLCNFTAPYRILSQYNQFWLIPIILTHRYFNNLLQNNNTYIVLFYKKEAEIAAFATALSSTHTFGYTPPSSPPTAALRIAYLSTRPPCLLVFSSIPFPSRVS